MNTVEIKTEINQVRTRLTKEDKFYFSADDICKILDLQNQVESLNLLFKDQKGFIPSKNLWLVTESGFHKLLFLSENKEAIKFKTWIIDNIFLEKNIDVENSEGILGNLKTLLHLYLKFSLVEDGRFELKQRLASKQILTYRYFEAIPADKTPRIKL